VEAAVVKQAIPDKSSFFAENLVIILTVSTKAIVDLLPAYEQEKSFFIFHRIQNNNFITISDSIRYITQNKIIAGI
jgi:hypothetical protein